MHVLCFFIESIASCSLFSHVSLIHAYLCIASSVHWTNNDGCRQENYASVNLSHDNVLLVSGLPKKKINSNWSLSHPRDSNPQPLPPESNALPLAPGRPLLKFPDNELLVRNPSNHGQFFNFTTLNPLVAPSLSQKATFAPAPWSATTRSFYLISYPISLSSRQQFLTNGKLRKVHSSLLLKLTPTYSLYTASRLRYRVSGFGCLIWSICVGPYILAGPYGLLLRPRDDVPFRDWIADFCNKICSTRGR